MLAGQFYAQKTKSEGGFKESVHSKQQGSSLLHIKINVLFRAV
jgi:hypothetical protein